MPYVFENPCATNTVFLTLRKTYGYGSSKEIKVKPHIFNFDQFLEIVRQKNYMKPQLNLNDSLEAITTFSWRWGFGCVIKQIQNLFESHSFLGFKSNHCTNDM
jgi:hypothetical protein